MTCVRSIQIMANLYFPLNKVLHMQGSVGPLFQRANGFVFWIMMILGRGYFYSMTKRIIDSGLDCAWQKIYTRMVYSTNTLYEGVSK